MGPSGEGLHGMGATRARLPSHVACSAGVGLRVLYSREGCPRPRGVRAASGGRQHEQTPGPTPEKSIARGVKRGRETRDERDNRVRDTRAMYKLPGRAPGPSHRTRDGTRARRAGRIAAVQLPKIVANDAARSK